jgi:two-component system phosphate regulon sensor histidine kinase PhoR
VATIKHPPPWRLFWRVLLPQLLVLLAGAALALTAIVATTEPGGPRSRLYTWAAGAVLLAGLLAVGLSWRLARRLARAFQAATDAVQRLDGAGGPTYLPVGLGDEVADLGRALTAVGGRLADRIAALEEDRQQLRAVLSGMVEGVVALDADERILYANDRAAELLELPAGPPVGRRLWEVVRQRQLLDAVRRALDQPEPARAEVVWDGTARSLTVHAARLPGPPPRGAVLVLHDTSELRRLERLRRDFVANVSHELKTPLAVIKACVETLLDGAVEDAEHRGPFLERIAQQSDRLHSLILDLLSLARIESGGELLDFRAVPIAPLVRDCAERHQARAEARRQQLAVTEGDPAAAAWADEEAVDQILDNLVDNALKYTPAGGRITVRWRVEADQVCLEVADTGIGIPAADLPRVFERFYRVDRARSRELGGTGLGLAIVKHLTQAMKGTVEAASTVGQGTTFTVRLPRAE